ncbi:MAG: pyroglutamyl-peptidase I [Oscillospiraceae bacterium]|nr:pyroglutamyl-peptidase I [Oscillospiraceae bacterium]
MKILVTGFDPFGGQAINPAFEAVKLLPDCIGGAEIVKIEIPTVFGKCAAKVEEAIEAHMPDCVLCVGQAGGRSSITVEKVAINYADARIADNEGNQPLDCKIVPDGENAYFATLPVKAMVENCRSKGIPANLSFTAGTYVCNDVMYRLLYMTHTKYHHIKGGFIHVPFAVQQVTNYGDGMASWEVSTIAKGLEYAIEAIANNKEDANIAMGTTH